MKAGYAIVSPMAYTLAAGKRRKIRCKCTGDGLLIDSKQHRKGVEENARFKYCDFFNHGETGNLPGICPECEEHQWYTI